MRCERVDVAYTSSKIARISNEHRKKKSEFRKISSRSVSLILHLSFSLSLSLSLSPLSFSLVIRTNTWFHQVFFLNSEIISFECSREDSGRLWQSSKRLSKHEDACAASFIHDYGYAYVLSAAIADISHNCPRSVVHFVFFSSFLFDRESSRHPLPIRIPLKHNKRSISQLIAAAKKLHLWLSAEAVSSNPGWHTL